MDKIIIVNQEIKNYKNRVFELEELNKNSIEKKDLSYLIINAPASICLLETSEHIYKFMNSEYKKLVGNRDFIGKSVRESLPEIKDQGFYEILDNVFNTGKTFFGKEMPLTLNNNGLLELVYLNFVYQPVFSHDNKIEGISVYAFDVTEQVLDRKKLEVMTKELLEKKTILKSILDSVGDGIIVADENEKFLVFNPAAKAILRKGETDKGKEKWSDFYGTFLPDKVTRFPYNNLPIIRSIRGESFDKVEMFIGNENNPNGRYISITGRPLKYPDGSQKGGVVTFRDITDIKDSNILLLKSEEFNKDALNSIPSQVAILDKDGTIIAVNESWNKFAVENGAVNTNVGIGINYLDICHKALGKTDNIAEQVLAGLKSVINGSKNSFNLEYKCNLPTEELWFNLNVVPLTGKEGVLLSHMNITEKKVAEEKLHESEELFRNSFDHAPIGMVITNLEGKFLRVNNAFIKMLGYTEKELLSEKIISITHPDDIPVSINQIKSLLEGKLQHSVFEKRYIHKSGEIIWACLNTVLNRDNNGNPLYFITQIENITQRKKSDEKLLEQAALLDITTDAITVRDMDDNIIYWNKGAEKLYGYTKSEVLNKNVYKTIYKKFSPEFDHALHAVIKNETWQGELHQVTKNDTEIIVDSKWILMKDSTGNPISILVVNSDITKRKILEAQVLRTDRLESIGTLASGIAHDLNNVLTPMMMSVEILKMRFNDKKGLILLEAMSKSTKYGAELVKQLLSFAKGVEVNNFSVDLGSLITEVKKIISSSFPQNIDIFMELPDDLKKISGDETQLNQVIMNLLVNARDAMPDGGIIRISAKNIYLDPTFVQMNLEAKIGNYILLTVSDTGSGIPKKIIDKIFEPFFTTKGVGHGTGLGLYTTIGIIKSHDGFINVSSKVGMGTEFKIYFPVSDKTEDISTINNSEKIFMGNGETILIIEDEESIVEAATQTLEQFNYNVLKAYDGVEGLTVYIQNKEKISIVITDVMLPLMDGHQIINGILKINPDEKFIVMSGHEQPENIQQLGEQIRFISKPFTANVLLSTLHQHLLP